MILGNSHTQCVSAAAGQAPGVEVHWLRVTEGARFGEMGMAEAQARVRDLDPGDRLVLMHLGTQHNLLGLLNHDRPFTVIAGETGLGPAEIVPRALMRAQLRAQIAAEKVVRALAPLARCPVFHAMPPPPRAALDPVLGTEKLYRGRSIARNGFSPGLRRLALWTLEREEVALYLAGLGVRDLPVPPGTVTPEGFLAPSFHARDATHANVAYGAKLIEVIRDVPLHALEEADR